MTIFDHIAIRQKAFLKKYFQWRVGNRPFTVFSNDCWGGEIYKLLNRPFNTPFIGLMLMGPCYIRLLSNPRHYLNLPLQFKTVSDYPAMREKRAGVSYPLAELGDSSIEIHFLHYATASDAAEKWKRRVERIDWDHLFVKYDCGKNYGSLALAEAFLELPYKNKLLIGNDNYGKSEIIIIEEYEVDAVLQFRNSFRHFDPIGWLKGKSKFTNLFQRLVCRIGANYL